MTSGRVMVKVYCRYFEKALCLRDDVTKCEDCPYYKLVEPSKTSIDDKRLSGNTTRACFAFALVCLMSAFLYIR